MTPDRIAAMWRESAGPEPELPKPLIWPFCRANGWDSGPEGLFGADQMRAAMTPSPEVLARFAQAVAEECEPTDFQLDQLFDAVHEHGEFGREFREAARRILLPAIRRHVKE